MDLFSEKELLIMALVVGGLLIIIGYLTILDIKDYLKNRKKDVALESVEEKEEVVVNSPPVDSMTAVLEEIEVLDFDEPVILKKEEKEINLIETDEEISFVELTKEELKEEAKKELERISIELENVENKDPFEDTITNFEIEQEENAIISLDELVKISDNLYDSNEAMQYDEGNEPITIDEVINKFNNSNNITEEANQVSYSEVNPIMSFYGYENTHNEMQFENTANYDKLDMELRKTNDFLNSLKEMHEKHEN